MSLFMVVFSICIYLCLGKLNEKSLPADGPSESMADTVKLIAATTNISPGNDGPTNDNDKRIQENKTSSKNGHIVSPSSGDINHSFQALAPCANPISSQVSSAALNEEKIIFQEPPQSSPLLHFNVVKENLSVEGGSKNISTSNVPQSETCASSLIKPSNFIYDESDSTDAKHRSEDHTGSPSKFELSREYPKRRRSSVCPAPVVAVSKKRTASWCVLCERPTGDDYDQHLDEPGAVICRNYKCQRGFHIACLRNAGYSASTINLDSFLCLNCSEKKILCLECQHAINDDNFIRCSVSACGNRFHSSCWKWEDKQCPRHVCKKCVDKEVRCGSESFNLRSDRYDCLRCSTSYHASCIPKSAVRLVLGHHPNKFVCERHEVLPNSIRWRPPLIIPLWVGVSTLKELSFSLSPEWLNGDAGNDEESVIILPEILGGSHPSHSESPKNNLDARRSGIAETETNIKPKSKAKLWTKNRKSEGGDVKPVEASSSFFANFDFVPEFSLEPPLGFAMEPYKSRSRNIYTFPRPSQTSREAAHICSCSPGSNCADDSCFNRSLQIECDARFCPCGELCRNQRLQKREWQPMRLIFTKDRGCGMMSQVPIQAGDLVIEYVGEVLDEVSFRQRAQENTEKKRPQDNYYMMQLSRHLVIDARKTGNNARFLNHSCSPNCRTEIWEVAKGELRAGIFAMYDIPAGVELTYDYNFELFSKAVNSESVPCRCGASNCSKFLGVRPLRINSKK